VDLMVQGQGLGQEQVIAPADAPAIIIIIDTTIDRAPATTVTTAGNGNPAADTVEARAPTPRA
jgi:hypothetical protein